MASINSVGSKNLTSSLYNSANVISGLASGLDTESMIEGLVDSYNSKIQNLTNKATKIEWKQESYRNIIAKMYSFSNKYTSYSSATNLLSPSFFNNAVNVTTKGENAGKISASGRTDSDIIIKSVSQLATAARYVTGSKLTGSTNGRHITASEGVDLTDSVTVGNLQGTLSLNYGNKTISIGFDDMTDIIEGETRQERTKALAALIEEKLGDETITLASGESVKASDRIQVSVSGGSIRFSDKSGAKNDVYISGASGTVASTLDLKNQDLDDEKNRVRSIEVKASTQFTRDVNTTLYLSGKTMNINLDGTSKTVTMPTVVQFGKDSYQIKDVNGGVTNVKSDELANYYTNALNVSLKKAFGDKITAENVGENGELKLQFTAPEGSDLLINSDVGGVLGIGKNASNYLSTSKTLADLLGTDENGNLNGVKKNYDGKYNFIINGVNIGSYDEKTTLAQIMNDVNANSEAGVKLSYSTTTREFVFTAKDTGSEGKIEMGDGLASAMFGKSPVKVDVSQKTRDFLGLAKDEELKGKKFSVEFENGKKVSFDFSSDTGTLQQLLDRVSSSLGDGMKASFSEDGTLVVKDAAGKTYGVRSYGEGDEVAQRLSGQLEKATGAVFSAGQDAKFVVSVNGSEKEMTRGSNTTTIDGLTVKLKGTFEDDGEGVSFQRDVDSDKIVDALKSMITDYNDMMGEIRKAYATLPYQTSSGAFKDYEPLSDEDKATMSESAIKAYEEKAKQGILFGDSNLSNLYGQLRNAFDASSAFGKQLHQMGISVSYNGNDGSSYLTLDENKLRERLESDPDSVMEVFTGSGSQEGVMQGLKTQLDRYSGTIGSTKGILVEQAGSPLSSASLLSNTWQKQIDSIGTEIEKWQDKLSDRVDYYTSMFSRLEVLINQMNSQSSTLAGLMGG